MSGTRLVAGSIAMAGVVPLVILYLLDSYGFTTWLAVAAPCFFGWCVAELVANILARPRLENRSPGDALRAWQPGSPDAGPGRPESKQ